MLPNTAIPSAPPSSVPVSEIAEAAPARSGGAAPMTTSTVSVITSPKPNIMTMQAATTVSNDDTPIWVSIPNPTTTITSPPQIRKRGCTQRTSAGAIIEPAIDTIELGTVHSPASNGGS